MSPPPPPLPLLRHDLSLLSHHDPSTRRLSMDSLRLSIQDYHDSRALPSFVDQLSSHTLRGGATAGGSVYVVSLFVELARVHRQAIVPFIPRIMGSVVRCISSSNSSGYGSSLHHACADVVASIAKYAIDISPHVDSPASPPAEVLGLLTRPLLVALCSNLEHVATGGAACIRALLEAQEWKFAEQEQAAEISRRCCGCLLDKGREWIGHLHLAKFLFANFTAGMADYRESLLHLAAAVLQSESGATPPQRRRSSSSSSSSWQRRVAAAQLIGTLLAATVCPTAGEPPLSSSAVDAAIAALDACKHDKTPMVRQAVAEAISCGLASDESVASASTSSPDLRCRTMDRLAFRKTKKSLWKGAEEEGTASSISAAAATFGAEAVASTPAAPAVRSPLYPAKQHSPIELVPSSVDRCLPHRLLSSSDLKENDAPPPVRSHTLVSLKSEELGYILFNTGTKLSRDIAGGMSTRLQIAADADVDDSASSDTTTGVVVDDNNCQDGAGSVALVLSRPRIDECLALHGLCVEVTENGVGEDDCAISDIDPTSAVDSEGFHLSRAAFAQGSTVRHMIGKDVHSESVSESGWSVRDNPIAGGDSSDDEQDDHEESVPREETFETKRMDAVLLASSTTKHIITTDAMMSFFGTSSSEVDMSSKCQEQPELSTQVRQWPLLLLLLLSASLALYVAVVIGGDDGDALVPT